MSENQESGLVDPNGSANGDSGTSAVATDPTSVDPQASAVDSEAHRRSQLDVTRGEFEDVRARLSALDRQ